MITPTIPVPTQYDVNATVFEMTDMSIDFRSGTMTITLGGYADTAATTDGSQPLTTEQIQLSTSTFPTIATNIASLQAAIILESGPLQGGAIS